MTTLSVKLSRPLDARLNALAARRGQRKSDVVREAIERLLEEPSNAGSTSVIELLRDLKGVGRAARDLSTGRRHLRGFGE
jgi:predicted DNA-binding protein